MRTIIITISLFCVLVVGCADEQAQKNADRQMNTALINTFNDIAMQNAIITQHTLFPYHFVENGSELNELGQRDFSILAKHFVQYPGQLNIRRNSTPENLYEARMEVIQSKLKEAGIDAELITISDGMPGGSGITTERMLVILENVKKESGAIGTTSSSLERGQ